MILHKDEDFFNHFKPDDAPGLNLIPIEHREINLILRILMLIILRTGSVLTNNSMLPYTVACNYEQPAVCCKLILDDSAV